MQSDDITNHLLVAIARKSRRLHLLSIDATRQSIEVARITAEEIRDLAEEIRRDAESVASV